MSRRSTPERLDAARLAATVALLVSVGLLPDRAEAALVAWAARTVQDGRPLTPADGRPRTRSFVRRGRRSSLEDVAGARSGGGRAAYRPSPI
jgi:hypothetical protein